MVYTLDNSKALILSVRPDGSSPASTKAPVEALNRIAYGRNVLAAVGGSNLMLYTLPSMELRFNIALGTSTSSIAFNDDASQVLVPLGGILDDHVVGYGHLIHISRQMQNL